MNVHNLCFCLCLLKCWTHSQAVKVWRGWAVRTYGALWRPWLYRMVLSWWSGSSSLSSTKSFTRCWFSSPSRTSWWSHWTFTGWLFYARTLDPPAVSPTVAVASYKEEEEEMFHLKTYSQLQTDKGKYKCFWNYICTKHPVIYPVIGCFFVQSTQMK